MMIPPDGLHVFDDVFEMHYQYDLYRASFDSYFKIIGWGDNSQYNTIKYECAHSQWNPEDVAQHHVIENLKRHEGIRDWIGDKQPKNCVVNLCRPGEEYSHHTHGFVDDVILIYIHMEWKRNWGGETIFYTRDGKNIDFVSEYVPNRVIAFDASIPHTIRPSTDVSPKYRLTMTVVFNNEDRAVARYPDYQRQSTDLGVIDGSTTD